MQLSKTSYWAIIITALAHLALISIFAYWQIDFDEQKDWSYINMSLKEIELPKPEPVEKTIIPKNYEEKGLDAKKYSVAKTNQAVNEATKELSKSQQAKIDQEIEQQIKEMALNESTTNLGKKGRGSLEGKIETTKQKKTNQQKSNKTKGAKDLGNKHNMITNISYYLKDRTEGLIGLSNPVYVCEGGGKVVINITVNRFGEVVSATVNSSKTTVKDACLKQAAKQAALTSSFNENMSATSKQSGTITYNFIGQ